MTKEQLENYALMLGNVGIALNQVEVKGEKNLNNLLASIQEIRKVRDAMKESAANDAENEHEA